MIDIADMITPEKKELVLKVKQVLDDLEPAVDQLVAEGLPFQKHQETIKTRREWNNKFLKLFKITTR